MLVTQVLLTFSTIKKFPGLDINGLADKIYELYGNEEAAKSLIYDEEHWLLRARIRELDCVEIREMGYYFNPNKRPYGRDEIISSVIENFLSAKKKP